MSRSAAAASISGKLANASRFRPDEDHTELRLALKEQRIADYIRETVDAAPPLRPEQRARLAALLVPRECTDVVG